MFWINSNQEFSKINYRHQNIDTSSSENLKKGINISAHAHTNMSLFTLHQNYWKQKKKYIIKGSCRKRNTKYKEQNKVEQSQEQQWTHQQQSKLEAREWHL